MVVYGLFDPDGELRYVGQTVRSTAQRLRDHLRPSALKKNNHRSAWIKSLLARGVSPAIHPIQVLASVEDLAEAERYWIAFFRARGCRLVNSSDGGEGLIEAAQRQMLSDALQGHVVSEETRQRIGAALKGRRQSDAVRQARSRALKGRKLSQEHIDKVAQAQRGRAVSPETRAKLAAAARARKHSPETKAKISASIWAQKHEVL